MNILLTGGSGFIGKNILESYLNEKYNIFAPKHIDLDLTNQNDVERFFINNKIDIVIHSATKPGHRNSKDTSNLLYNNTRMFFNIVNNKHNFKKMIFLGSGAMYDSLNYIPKMKEDYFGMHIPEDEHGFSKFLCGKYIENVDNILELRVFGIFGKYEDYAIRFISNAICKAIYNLPITIKQNRNFDYLYINDLISVIDYFINNENSYNSYNVTPNKAIDLYTIAEIVRKTSGKDLPIIVANPGMGLEYSGDNSRLKNEIYNLEFTSIEKAISELYKWYSDNKNLIKKELLMYDK